MKDIIKKIFSLFSPKERKQICWLVLAILIMGLLETTGIASILPFLAVIANPETINTNNILFKLYTATGLTDQTHFLFFLGIGVLVILIISNGFSAFTNWLLLRFIYFQGHRLSSELFQQYLKRPYSFFLNHNSSDLMKNIISEVHRVIVGVLTPTMQIVSRLIIAVCILVFLVAMDPFLALLVFTVCGGSYVAVFITARKKLTERGKITTKTQSQRFKLTSEAFGGIKDLKLLNREANYITRYNRPSLDFAASEATSQAITILPKYALETIVFGGMMLIMLYTIGIKKEISQVLPILGLYAFAGYRLMPGFNQIFQGSSLIRYHSAALDTIHEHIIVESIGQQRIDNKKLEDNLPLKKEIRLENICFNYPGSDSATIKNLNITIQANSTIGIVGSTGSGKTTLIDIILGLLKIDSGKFIVDDTYVNSENLNEWKKNLGYVPQQIFIADDTVTKNIAFGIPDDEIDQTAVVQAAIIANINDFISLELPKGYDTNLGERGAKLSGGQRQRIGIARALYHAPKVLILDEATSALDGVTENAVMDAIQNLAGRKTIIMVAHRITTVKECDTIFVMENGGIIASGNYEKLINSCDQFKAMAQSSDRATINQQISLC